MKTQEAKPSPLPVMIPNGNPCHAMGEAYIMAWRSIS